MGRRGREIIARSQLVCWNSSLAGSHDRTVVVDDTDFEELLNVIQFTMVRDTNMEKFQDLANKLRIECVRATEASKSGYERL